MLQVQGKQSIVLTAYLKSSQSTGDLRTLVLSSMGIVMMPGAEGSSAEEWNCATYGCRSASRAVMRFAGLNCTAHRGGG